MNNPPISTTRPPIRSTRNPTGVWSMPVTKANTVIAAPIPVHVVPISGWMSG